MVDDREELLHQVENHLHSQVLLVPLPNQLHVLLGGGDGHGHFLLSQDVLQQDLHQSLVPVSLPLRFLQLNTQLSLVVLLEFVSLGGQLGNELGLVQELQHLKHLLNLYNVSYSFIDLQNNFLVLLDKLALEQPLVTPLLELVQLPAVHDEHVVEALPRNPQSHRLVQLQQASHHRFHL